MKIALAISLVLISIAAFAYSLTGFKSAFEADQECHSILNTEYSQFNDYGCDHDLETRQWLLYRSGLDDQPSKVVKRFRY